jgi:hypothetical protein
MSSPKTKPYGNTTTKAAFPYMKLRMLCYTTGYILHWGALETNKFSVYIISINKKLNDRGAIASM